MLFLSWILILIHVRPSIKHKWIILWQYPFRFMHRFTLSNAFLFFFLHPKLWYVIISLLPKIPLVFSFSTFQWCQIVFICLKMSFKGYFCCTLSSILAVIFISSLKISLTRCTYCCSFENKLHFPLATFKVCFSAVFLCSNLPWFSLYLFCLEANNISTIIVQCLSPNLKNS